MYDKHLYISNVPAFVSAMAGSGNPLKEARDRAATKTQRQAAEVSEVAITVTISVEAIANNWNRVINRLEREIDTRSYNLQTSWYLNTIHAPNPAYDGWTILLDFGSLEDMNTNLERLRDKIERICNDHRN